MSLQTRLRFGFNLFLLFSFGYMIYEARDFQRLARYMPLSAAIACFLLMLILIGIDYYKYRKVGYVAADETIGTATLGKAAKTELEEALVAEEAVVDGSAPVGSRTSTDDGARPAEAELDAASEERAALRRAATVWAWLLLYVALIAVFGLTVATVLYLVGYLWRQAKAGPVLIVVGTLLTLGGMHLMRVALNLRYPANLLEWFFG